ncbi:hypothetical protein PP304_gp128 [Gordonia phage Phendrix]|uniref:Uncharacterized protein n=2 Tax=Godonkavirus TaxID=2733178 RepID=A0A4D6E2U8_9CAUD|nr:hypothetical protein HOV33_gp010 [Gordonia phage GodonK]YP_009821589.1 hypothetical protein HOV33_gp132 [Gordonia phage GodonK]YP_010649053.1 hypothetical protein PP304_gp009 [Gordonia phage Phendrix]YP_010649239.1 hypothetical protein PP304_gp128 [Gordonia phage Phendrix]QBZ72629.1 hypothetical protein SEA_GODONK_10 [Gordonia phage GodonK]QBZ72824.1 hypothetical protein SEA_GODONK_236 [Gordonia phage GodonK]QDK02557.1 hypothetical protein SEA_PHENDRIX_9 [Gordonia phage Phendrix]QDK02741.
MFTATVINHQNRVLFKETHTNYLFAEENLSRFVHDQGWGLQSQDPVGSFHVYNDGGESPAIARITW